MLSVCGNGLVELLGLPAWDEIEQRRFFKGRAIQAAKKLEAA
jgi:hypothetical protein